MGLPPLPPGCPPRFRVTVHGTIFGRREARVAQLQCGEGLLLLPDPPGDLPPRVWVHREGGGRVGHLPPEVEAWMAPWLRSGGKAKALVLRVGEVGTPSYRRLLVEVECLSV